MTSHFNNIKFIAVARATDKVVVCSRLTDSNSSNRDTYYDMLGKVLRASTWADQVKPDSRHTLECDPNKFHFTADSDDRVFIVIADMAYPVRVAFELIQDLKQTITPKYGDKVLSVQEGGLDRDCSKLLKQIAEKFDDPAKSDKLSRVQDQVAGVTSVMQDNIKTVLASSEKLENIEEKSDGLSQQALVFKNQGVKLRKAMWWKNCKMKIMLAAVVILILTVLIVVIYINVKPSSSPAPAPAPAAPTPSPAL